MAHVGVVLGQQVSGEVAGQVAPYGVDVIGLVLSVVVLDEQAWTAEGVAGAAIANQAWTDMTGVFGPGDSGRCAGRQPETALFALGDPRASTYGYLCLLGPLITLTSTVGRTNCHT